MDEKQISDDTLPPVSEEKKPRRRGRPRKETRAEDLLPLTLGTVLRQARQKQHLKTSTIAKKLKIKEIYLNALEDGNYYLFPGWVYGVGFLRSYATYLGLDADELVARFRRETKGLKAESLEMPYKSDKNILPSFKTAIKAVVLLLVVYLVWNVFKIMTYTPVPEPVLTPVVTEDLIPVTEPIPESPKVTEPVVTVSKIVKFAPKQDPKMPERTPVVYGLKKTARVSFVASAKTWIEIRDTEADSILLSQNLDVGDRYNPDEDSEGMVLKTTNAGGLDVYVDGRKIGPLGTKGQTKAGIRMDADSLLKE